MDNLHHTLEFQSLGDYLSSLSEKTPTPGGGNLCGVLGALASAMAQMVASYSAHSKKLSKEDKEQITHSVEELCALQKTMLHHAEQDTLAYQQVMEAYRDSTRSIQNHEQIDQALLNAMQPSFLCAQALYKLFQILYYLLDKVSYHLLSDLGIAAHTAHSALKGCELIIAINAHNLSKKELATRVTRDLKILLIDSSEVYESVNKVLTKLLSQKTNQE